MHSNGEQPPNCPFPWAIRAPLPNTWLVGPTLLKNTIRIRAVLTCALKLTSQLNLPHETKKSAKKNDAQVS